MFSSSHFAPEYFGEHFRPITGRVYEPPSGGGGTWVDVNQDMLSQFNLNRDDREILEFVVAFVLSR